MINTCLICNFKGSLRGGPTSISCHLKTHGLNRKDYFDRYLKKPGDGVCKHCSKPTEFQDNFYFTYRSFCNSSCKGSRNMTTANRTHKEQFRKASSVRMIKTMSTLAKDTNFISMRSKVATQQVRDPNSKFGTRRGGTNTYKDTLFRSYWESDFAKLLDAKSIPWEYEKHTFELDKDKRYRYTPDFYIPIINKFIEIKPKHFVDDRLRSFSTLLNIDLAILSIDDFADFVGGL